MLTRMVLSRNRHNSCQSFCSSIGPCISHPSIMYCVLGTTEDAEDSCGTGPHFQHFSQPRRDFQSSEFVCGTRFHELNDEKVTKP